MISLIAIILFKLIGLILVVFSVMSLIYAFKLKRKDKVGTALLVLIGMVIILNLYLFFGIEFKFYS